MSTVNDTGARRGSGLRRIGRVWSDRPLACSCGAVVLVVLLANLLYLTGTFDPNPLGQYSNLALRTSRGILTGTNNIDPNQGFVSQALGHLAAKDWLHGHIPWWNPYEGLGMPLAGEMQSAAMFPLVILDVFSQGQILFRIVLEVGTGIAMLFLLRRLVTSEAAALAGAVVFALNGTYAWMFHAPGNPIAFLPVILLAVEQARAPSGWLRSGWPLLAVGLALSIYAGFPEVAFIDGLLAVVWAAVRASEMTFPDLRRFAGRLAAGAAVGLLLAGPILVAFLTFVQGANLLDHSGAGLANAFLDRSTALPAVVMPYINGPVFSWLAYDHTTTSVAIDFWGNVGGYAGTALLTLALVSLGGRRDRRLRIALAAWVVLTIGRTVGVPILRDIVNAVPGVGQTAFYRYSDASWTLALIVLAVLAIDDLQRRPERRRALIGGASALLVVAGLAGLATKYHGVVHDAPYHWLWFGISVGVAVAIVAGCVAAALLSPPGLRAGVLATIMAVEAFVLFVLPQMAAPRSVAVDTAPVRYLQTHLGGYRYFTLGPLAPNYGSYYGLASVNINDEPLVGSYFTYVTKSLDQNVYPAVFTGTVRTDQAGPSPTDELLRNLAGYEAAGVKYVIQPQNSPRLVYAGKPLPTVFSDPIARIVVLPDPQPLESTVGGGCTLASASFDVTVADCSGAGSLIRREQYLAGWSATNQGHAIPLARYRSVFQSVPLHPGRNVIRWSFRPPHTYLAFAGFAVGVIVLLAAIVLDLFPDAPWQGPVGKHRHRRRPPPTGS